MRWTPACCPWPGTGYWQHWLQACPKPARRIKICDCVDNTRSRSCTALCEATGTVPWLKIVLPRAGCAAVIKSIETEPKSKLRAIVNTLLRKAASHQHETSLVCSRHIPHVTCSKSTGLTSSISCNTRRGREAGPSDVLPTSSSPTRHVSTAQRCILSHECTSTSATCAQRSST